MNLLKSNCIKCGCAFTGQAVIVYREDWRCKSHTEPKAPVVDDMPEDPEFYYNQRAEERFPRY